MATPGKIETAIRRLAAAQQACNDLDSEQLDLSAKKKKATENLHKAVDLVIRVESDPQTELPLNEAD